MRIATLEAMACIDPHSVVAPQRHISAVEVLYDGGPGGYALARLVWDGEEEVGIRWNGSPGEPGMGNPQSRARPTWFLLPREMAQPAIDLAEQNNTAIPRWRRAIAPWRQIRSAKPRLGNGPRD